jgi:hypothetical protein
MSPSLFVVAFTRIMPVALDKALSLLLLSVLASPWFNLSRRLDDKTQSGLRKLFYYQILRKFFVFQENNPLWPIHFMV